MFLGDQLSTGLTIGGGAAGLCAFVLAVVKIFSQDRVWRDIITEIRAELVSCRGERETDKIERAEEHAEWKVERAELEMKVKTLEGEVSILRRQVHADYWLGIEPTKRVEPTKQAKHPRKKGARKATG